MKSNIITRTGIFLKPTPARVIIRFFSPNIDERIMRIIGRITSLDKKTIDQELDCVLSRFANRHLDVKKIFLEHYGRVRSYMITDLDPPENSMLLIGAHFTSEFSLECAALFNPSIVPHPDQSGMKKGSLRFIMSLRATGEGHISSIVFRSGIIDGANSITIDKTGNLVTSPEKIQNSIYEKKCFSLKLYEMGFENEFSDEILSAFGKNFSYAELKEQIEKTKSLGVRKSSLFNETLMTIYSLAEANYEIKFNAEHGLGERAIFPYSVNEKKGLEDARFVLFLNEESGKVLYYATYTAYDGHNMFPQLLETEDFLHFKIITLNGGAVQNKGMALFPRKINGLYTMLSRQDNENIFIMQSDNIHFWHETKKIMKPSYPWEFVQLGNCGSPIETEQGWLVLTHGVGAMRRYCIGAILLDKEDPSKLIGRLREPLLEPDENEREGYVPNVVYTCGALIHHDKLVLPYAMSDYATSIALVDIKALMKRLVSD